MCDTQQQIGDACEVPPELLTRGSTDSRQKSMKPGWPFLEDEVAFFQVARVGCASVAAYMGHIHLEHLAALAEQVRRQWEVG
jgi:hypothetical protein